MPSTINSISIPRLLEWWQQRQLIATMHSNRQGKQTKSDGVYLQAYYRLLEVYSVVKSGGVQAQKEAVRAFAKRESLLLRQRLAEIETTAQLAEYEKQSAKRKIEQEISELHSANDWRLTALTSIAPAEEATVRQHLSDIERAFMQTHCV